MAVSATTSPRRQAGRRDRTSSPTPCQGSDPEMTVAADSQPAIAYQAYASTRPAARPKVRPLSWRWAMTAGTRVVRDRGQALVMAVRPRPAGGGTRVDEMGRRPQRPCQGSDPCVERGRWSAAVYVNGSVEHANAGRS